MLVSDEARMVLIAAMKQKSHWATKLVAIYVSVTGEKDIFRAAQAVGVSRTTYYRILPEVTGLLERMRVVYRTTKTAHLRVVAGGKPSGPAQGCPQIIQSQVSQRETGPQVIHSPDPIQVINLKREGSDVDGTSVETAHSSPPPASPQVSIGQYVCELRDDWNAIRQNHPKAVVPFCRTQGRAAEGLGRALSDWGWDTVRSVHRWECERVHATGVDENYYAHMFVGDGFAPRLRAYQRRRTQQLDLTRAMEQTPEELEMMKRIEQDEAQRAADEAAAGWGPDA